jgi:hypothetical protein
LNHVRRIKLAAQPPTEIRAQLARIGVGAGKTFSFKALSPEQQALIAEGMKAGNEKVDQAMANAGRGINGWRVGSQYGDSKFSNGDWLKRAAAARAGIYANNAVEAIYPQTRVDVDGQTLDSSKHNYTLTFAAGQLPPVNAFWSVTMYDGKSESTRISQTKEPELCLDDRFLALVDADDNRLGLHDLHNDIVRLRHDQVAERNRTEEFSRVGRSGHPRYVHLPSNALPAILRPSDSAIRAQDLFSGRLTPAESRQQWLLLRSGPIP